MFKDGFNNIISMDISNEIAKIMDNRLERYEGNLSYIVGDVFNMKFESSSFEAVIDKALLDSILCKEDGINDAINMCKEISRILGIQGKFLCVSHSFDRGELIFGKLPWKWERLPISLKDLVDGNEEENSISKDKKDINKKASQKIKNENLEKAEHYLYIMTKTEN